MLRRRVCTVPRRDRLAYHLRAKHFADVSVDEYQVAEILVHYAIQSRNFRLFASVLSVSKICTQLANQYIAGMQDKQIPRGMPRVSFSARSLSVFGRCHLCAGECEKRARVWHLCSGKLHLIGLCGRCREKNVVKASHLQATHFRERIYLHRTAGRTGCKAVGFDRRLGDPSLSLQIRCWRGRYPVTFVWTDRELACSDLECMNMKTVLRPAIRDLEKRDLRHTAQAYGIYQQVLDGINSQLAARGLRPSPYPRDCAHIFQAGVGYSGNGLVHRLRPFLVGRPTHPAHTINDPTKDIVEQCALQQKYPVCGDLLFDPSHVALGTMGIVEAATEALELENITFKFSSLASWHRDGKFVRVWQFALQISPVAIEKIAVDESRVERLCGCSLRQACLPNKTYRLTAENAVHLVRDWDLGLQNLEKRILRAMTSRQNAVRSCAHSVFHEVPKVNGRCCALFCCSTCGSGSQKKRPSDLQLDVHTGFFSSGLAWE